MLHAAVTRESEKHEQANQKIHQLQELLEAAKVTHREQVDALGADYTEKEAKSDGRMLRLLHEMDVGDLCMKIFPCLIFLSRGA